MGREIAKMTYSLQNVLGLIPNLRRAALMTGTVISVPMPWFLIVNCGPFRKPGSDGRKRMVSEPFPFSLSWMVIPYVLSLSSSSLNLREPLDMAFTHGATGIGNYPGRDKPLKLLIAFATRYLIAFGFLLPAFVEFLPHPWRSRMV